MATISNLGVGSNLDLGSLLTQLQTAESQPLVMLQQQQTSYTTKLSAYGMLKNALGALQTAANKLANPALFQGVKATASAADVLSATADTTTTPGSYLVNVTQLAQAQSLAAPGQASAKTAIGTGTITIDFGTISGGSYDAATGKYSGASFAADTERTAVPITIDAQHNTLEGIRDAINGAKAGVTASIVNDGSGAPARLVLVSAETGKASSMRISVAGDQALQDLLGHDPAGGQALQQTAAGLNAELSVNGIAVTSKSNAVKEAIQGTTLTLAKVGSSNLTVAADSTTVETALNDFVKAYNSLQGTAKSLSGYDADKKVGAALLGDATLRNLMSRVQSIITTPQAGVLEGEAKVMSGIGITIQKDGTLSVDSAKLKDALARNMAGVSRLFASDKDSTTGYGKQLSALVDGVNATGGALKVATDGISTTLKQLDKQYSAMQERVEAKVAIYRAQFTQLDLLMSNMSRTASYLTQQFAALNKTSSNS